MGAGAAGVAAVDAAAAHPAAAPSSTVAGPLGAAGGGADVTSAAARVDFHGPHQAGIDTLAGPAGVRRVRRGDRRRGRACAGC
nr:hypothetical protein [Angustibacter aerolatus]